MADNQINVEKLKELLGQDFIASDEHYELNWAGKFAARREIQKTSSLTLRPDVSNPVNAQHMLIEGENLEVLRVLQKSYYGKVKTIYIDPPYNTGNDSFVYPDDYSETLEAYQKRTGEKNDAGYLNKQSLWKKNSKESGQYHSAWLSMMYPRLYLARNLLRDDGVVFISIDDNEIANLKLICDEIFGPENFVAQIEWKKKTNGNNMGLIPPVHDHILSYAKKLDLINEDVFGLPLSDEFIKKNYSNPDNDPRGPWTTMDLSANHEGPHFPITNPVTKEVFLPSEGRFWVFNEEEVKRRIEDGRIIFGKTGNARPVQRVFLKDRQSKRLKAETWWDQHGLNSDGTDELKGLFGKAKIFVHSKPSILIRNLVEISTSHTSEDLVLDFFAGSGTTAQAVMELNQKDGGVRQSISIQMPELLEEGSEAHKAGYLTIADITRARIEKVISKLKIEFPEKNQNLACANFTLAPSSFKVWRTDVDNANALREQLSMFQSAEKSGQGKRLDEHTCMLAELLLKHGLGALGVHAIAKPRQVAGVAVHRVLMADDKPMWLCFETYTEALKDEIVKAIPAQVVMLNSCFVGKKADEQLANLQLELAGLDISFTVI
jgi:adenine-specific DNA-methyltransferase